MAYEARLRAWMRWNAMAMVVRANRDGDNLGGHIASFTSVATMFGTGFNHFWRAPTKEFDGDLVYFQGHSSPGIYARALSRDDCRKNSWSISGVKSAAMACRRIRIPG